MTLSRARSIAYEASLLLAEAAEMFGTIALCKLLGGHTEPEWQRMSTGRIGKCARCSSTIAVET